MKKALLFDCDGVIGDTERYGHLPAFNQMWREKGIDYQWTLEEYAVKLKIGGGKERMSSLRDEPGFRAVFSVPDNEEEWWDIVADWHQSKGKIYKELVNSGAIPGRPGVKRLMEEALEAGWLVAVCSTSALSSVEAIASHVMGPDTFSRLAGVFAGDVVKAKKPAPDIYDLAVEKLGLEREKCVVVEDSRNGLLSAVAAGMACLVTYNDLTRDQDFREADLVVSDLGEPGGEPIVVAENRTSAKPAGYIGISDLEQIIAR